MTDVGPANGRLRWILFFVAFGAVIAALAITFWRHGPYGLFNIASSVTGLVAGVALVILIAALLIALVVWLTKRKRQPTPGRQAAGGTEASRATYEKRSYGWVWTILVLALLGIFVLWLVKPEAMEPVKRWTEKRFQPSNAVDTLYCGTDGYIKLAMKPEITVVVMPCADTTALDDTTDYAEEEESYWTAKLVRPSTSPQFWIEPEGVLDLEKFYAEGESSFLSDFDPTREVVDSRKITGVRFSNNGSEPVRVRIRLY